MRLLQIHGSEQIVPTKDLIGSDIPRYAILSHTWNTDGDEVSFKDLIADGRAQSEPSYKKIRFCGQQASRDGLDYFWVDTCCIDRSNSAELQEAINSMFAWYRDAARCYVHLSDVSKPFDDAPDDSEEPSWEAAFRKSRWFTRGWTLQELIAPASVEFFSKEGTYLGSKKSLEDLILEITAIPVTALRGSPLSSFSVTERMTWADTRQTTRQEDQAYSLLGIFNVFIPLIYGEGNRRARERLKASINEATKGDKREDFLVTFSLDIVETEHFVGRDAELQNIHDMLRGDGSRRVAILHGLGGIGKTQLAAAYAKRYRDSYSGIFWLNIADEDSLKQSFATIFRRISRQHRLPSGQNSENNAENMEEIVAGVKEWLSLPNNTRWLMIYDNYDNPVLPGKKDATAVDIQKYLPESYQGCIIITTRSSRVKPGRYVNIKRLDDLREGRDILVKSSGREDLAQDPATMDLVKKLDGLPLALATAGAYLHQTTISCARYLRLYESSWMKLQKSSPELNSYDDRMLYSTWNLTFENMKRRNELSARLLQFWAYFNNEDIWFELFQHTDASDPEWLRDLAEDELSFTQAIRVLSEHGLVEAAPHHQDQLESGGYSIHSCVHSWALHVLNQQRNEGLEIQALKLIAAHVPATSEAQWWITQRRLLPHAAKFKEKLMENELTGKLQFERNRIAKLNAEQNYVETAEKIFQQGIRIGEALGPDEVSVFDAANYLGLLYSDQGRLNEAEKMYQQALRGRERILGPNNITTLGTIQNLGSLYMVQGKFNDAEKMYQKSIEGKEKTAGLEHTTTLDAISNLGVLYQRQGRLVEAEKLFRRVLQSRERIHGADHTSTLDSITNLGILYNIQGRMDDAEKLLKQAFHGRERALGKDHISTLRSRSSLAYLYKDQGKQDDAENILHQMLQQQYETLRQDPVFLFGVTHILGSIYYDQGKLDDAEIMCLRALQGKKSVLGPTHVSTLSILSSVGRIYRKQGRLDDAEEKHQWVIQRYTEKYSSNCTLWPVDALESLVDLGQVLIDKEDLRAARDMYYRAHVAYKGTLGESSKQYKSIAVVLPLLDEQLESRELKNVSQA